jgi:hypothetical protein
VRVGDERRAERRGAVQQRADRARDPDDFDGNGSSDLAVFRPAGGQWFINGVSSPVFGQVGDIPVSGDYNGNGTADVAVYRPSTGQWFVNGGSPALIQWGRTGDIPVPADYDGDKKTDTAVWRTTDSNAGVWLLNLPGGQVTVSWGVRGDVRCPATTMATAGPISRSTAPSTGQWFLAYAASGFTTGSSATWGLPGDIPVRADLGQRPETRLRGLPPVDRDMVHAPTNSPATSFQFGLAGDIPLSLDINGDGFGELCVWRPATGQWFIRNRVAATTSTVAFGLVGDIPNRRPPASAERAGVRLRWRRRVRHHRLPPVQRHLVHALLGLGLRRRRVDAVRPERRHHGEQRLRRRPSRRHGGLPPHHRAVVHPSILDRNAAHAHLGRARRQAMPADYDGDGRTDIAIYRPSTAQWFILRSGTGVGVAGGVGSVLVHSVRERHSMATAGPIWRSTTRRRASGC